MPPSKRRYHHVLLYKMDYKTCCAACRGALSYLALFSGISATSDVVNSSGMRLYVRAPADQYPARSLTRFAHESHSLCPVSLFLTTSLLHRHTLRWTISISTCICHSTNSVLHHAMVIPQKMPHRQRASRRALRLACPLLVLPWFSANIADRDTCRTPARTIEPDHLCVHSVPPRRTHRQHLSGHHACLI